MNITGWKPDSYDSRDMKMSYKTMKQEILPKSIDLRSGFKEVYNQGSLGSCTANAICSAFEYKQGTQKLDEFDSSRLFLYYNERVMLGTVGEDSGASIRDGMKSVNKDGICDESHCPYDISKFTQRPRPEAYKDAEYHKSVKYTSVPRTLNDLKTALCKGHPIVFGFMIFQNFTSGWNIKTDPMPMPSGRQLGGHAVLVVGYDDDKQCFIIRNSWGSNWGDEGNFLMPYQFIVSNYCMDFWIIEEIHDTEPEPVPDVDFNALIMDNRDIIDGVVKKLEEFSKEVDENKKVIKEVVQKLEEFSTETSENKKVVEEVVRKLKQISDIL